MNRAIKIGLNQLTVRKHRQIGALLEAYRAAVNFYIQSLWNLRGKLDKDTLARLTQTRLSERYKSQALKQALEIVCATKKAAKETGRAAGRPVFRGAATLDAKFVTIEHGRGSFDLVIKLSVLHKGERLTIPCRKTAVLNKWLAIPGAKLKSGCSLSRYGLALFVEVPDAESKTAGQTIGVDVGMHKLLSDSSGNHYGTGIKDVLTKIRRSKPKGQGRRRAFAHRLNYINRVVNQLPWGELCAIGVEDLKHLKHGKKKNRGKTFRKAAAPWTYRQVLNRVTQKAQENRVRLVEVDPANTSQCCPECSTVRRDNRKGERFACRMCGYTADADFVGARNILARTLATTGSVESPMLISRLE